MVLTIRSMKKEARQRQLSVQEAFVLWDLLKGKYDALELNEMYQTFAHDADLKFILGRLIETFNQHKESLEKIMKEFSIPGPDQYRGPSNWAGNPEALRDEFIALNSLTQLQSRVHGMLRAIRICINNDRVRKVLLKMIKPELDHVELLVNYLKLKGWLATPPLYPSTPPDVTEIIDVTAVGKLWDHLTFRYDNIWLTKVFREVVHDGDFRIILERGLDKLAKQVEVLEKECKTFGITLPKRPAEVFITPSSSEVIDDDKIYRSILAGLQGAMQIHAEAATHTLVNDRIRHIFQDLLLQELDMFDKFVKYGKMKGWLHPCPNYRAE